MSFLLALAACLIDYLQRMFPNERPPLHVLQSNLALVDNIHLRSELDIHRLHKFVLFTFDMPNVIEE